MHISWVLIISAVALVYAYFNYSSVKRKEEGTEKMSEISSYIREGARTFLTDEARSVFATAIFVALALGIVTEWYVGVAFVFGAVMSMLAGYIGMRAATIANVRVANTARVTKSVSAALKVAYAGGSVMGLSVAGLAVLGLGLVYVIFGKVMGQLENLQVVTNWLGINYIPFTMTVSGYALGCSLIALYNRVGGGIYTKAADMAADLVGKTEVGLPEDDPRNPATIADNVGDNVGDVAGLGSDLLESFVGSIVAATVLALYMSVIYNGKIDSRLAENLTIFPISLAAAGLVASMMGISFVLLKRGSDEPQKDLDTGLWISALLTLIFGTVLSYTLFGRFEDLSVVGFRYGWYSPWGAMIVGIAVGMLTGFWAEYYTSDRFRPTRELSLRSISGVGLVITGGISLGMKSTFLPTLTIVVGMLISSYVAGLYGIAIAALGMLSFVATSVAVDSYGPIADNAGGISEMAGLEEEVRKITDKLDAVGNTTAAIGKGFAIGSAVLAALSLFASYIFSQLSAEALSEMESEIGRNLLIVIGEKARLFLTDAKTISGALIGGALPYLFAAMVMDSVTEAAKAMIEEVRRQFREIPGIKEGKAKPDYNRCIAISNRQALKEMKLPSLLALFTPVVSGFLLGPEFVGGLLIGTVVSGSLVAITMANSGGAWDNAKKFLESGKLEGAEKGSEEHKALVVGDTVGDPMKDAAGPSINILIKIMSVVSILMASLFAKYHLF